MRVVDLLLAAVHDRLASDFTFFASRVHFLLDFVELLLVLRTIFCLLKFVQLVYHITIRRASGKNITPLE